MPGIFDSKLRVEGRRWDSISDKKAFQIRFERTANISCGTVEKRVNLVDLENAAK